MKTLIRVGVLTAAVAALALGGVTGAGAGNGGEYGTIIVTPDPVEVGGTVAIFNAGDEESACEDSDGGELWAVGLIYHVDTFDFDQEFEAPVNDDGSWSAELTIPNDDAAIGTWIADVYCVEYFGNVGSLTTADFAYPETPFQVVGADTPEPPDEDTAPAEEVRAAPRFTG